MAKIKTEKYQINGIQYSFNFNCSPKGVFSVSIPMDLRQILNVDYDKLTGNSLDEVEKAIKDAVLKYRNSKTLISLKIGITFKASGSFTKDSEGRFIKEFLGYGNPFVMNVIGNKDLKSAIGFDYRVLIEENRDGNINYYETAKIPDDPDFRPVDHKIVHQGYISKYIISGMMSKEKIIDFSDNALSNLRGIEISLQKASEFLINLLSSEDLQYTLEQNNGKLLN